MTTRQDIINRIRRGVGRAGPVDDEAAKALNANLDQPTRNTVPARADGDRATQIALFIAMAEEAAATVERVDDAAKVPRALTEYLTRQNLPMRVVMAPDAALAAVPWEREPMLTVRRGPAEPSDEVSVTPSFAAIAETGTLMVTSGPSHPSTLNLLPDTHVAVVWENQIVGSFEDGWDRLRAAAQGQTGQMPRTVLFVTGPSRSADIEQTLQMGAHGPRRLHIMLVNNHAGQTQDG